MTPTPHASDYLPFLRSPLTGSEPSLEAVPHKVRLRSPVDTSLVMRGILALMCRHNSYERRRGTAHIQFVNPEGGLEDYGTEFYPIG
jgi:hypothetical protein